MRAAGGKYSAFYSGGAYSIWPKLIALSSHIFKKPNINTQFPHPNEDESNFDPRSNQFRRQDACHEIWHDA
jgi:hypothetical protein